MPARRSGTTVRGKHAAVRDKGRTHTVRLTDGQLRKMETKTDFKRLDAMTDRDIARQIADNPDAAPEFTDELFERVEMLVAEPKREQIALKVESDVLAFFRASGPKYQTRMNAVLRAYMEQAKKQRRK